MALNCFLFGYFVETNLAHKIGLRKEKVPLKVTIKIPRRHIKKHI
jgi:hypothetical protein